MTIETPRIDRRTCLVGAAAFTAAAAVPVMAAPRKGSGPLAVLDYPRFAHHVTRFNTMEPERPLNLILNADSWDWMTRNVPAFECPDAQVEEIYWYRWWTYRKAFVTTPRGITATEFYDRAPVSSAVGHHVMEGRWLRDASWAENILRYWMKPGPAGEAPMDQGKYSGWSIWAAYQRWLVTGDSEGLAGMLGDFEAYYRAWEERRMNPDGSFWQYDVRDAMEESISGSRTDKNLRPPLNAYMYGNAVAMAAIARRLGRDDLERTYAAKAETLKQVVEQRLWDDEAKFYKVRYVHPGQADDNTLCTAREELGYIPWYFDLPARDAGREAAWSQLTDPYGFKAPFGITTAERRHPKFRYRMVGGCEWNGPVWPFATSQTLTALGNVLCDRQQSFVGPRDYFEALRTYARATYWQGKPYIGEYLDEMTGVPLQKTPERGRYYNHSTFCDLVITGLVGLRPQADGSVVVNPLVPEGAWDWFCLDGVPYRGWLLTIAWDRTGERYGRGKGLHVLADGVRIAHSARLTRLTAQAG